MKNLESVVAPPKQPLEVPSAAEWSTYEGKLGTGFPDDYKRHVERYGSGGFDQFIWIFNPKAKSSYFNLMDQASRILAGEKELREKHGASEVPFRLFPEFGGLLPFGITDNGDTLFWKTGGDSNRWTVVVNTVRTARYEEFGRNMTDFLVGVLSGELKCKAFPEDVPSAAPTFDLPVYLTQ
jgi:hypothetical protein